MYKEQKTQNLNNFFVHQPFETRVPCDPPPLSCSWALESWLCTFHRQLQLWPLLFFFSSGTFLGSILTDTTCMRPCLSCLRTCFTSSATFCCCFCWCAFCRRTWLRTCLVSCYQHPKNNIAMQHSDVLQPASPVLPASAVAPPAASADVPPAFSCLPGCWYSVQTFYLCFVFDCLVLLLDLLGEVLVFRPLFELEQPWFWIFRGKWWNKSLWREKGSYLINGLLKFLANTKPSCFLFEWGFALRWIPAERKRCFEN